MYQTELIVRIEFNVFKKFFKNIKLKQLNQIIVMNDIIQEIYLFLDYDRLINLTPYFKIFKPESFFQNDLSQGIKDKMQ